MTVFKRPENIEEIYDALSFFEQIISDYYIETEKNFNDVINIRKSICHIYKSTFQNLIDDFYVYEKVVRAISKSNIITQEFFSKPKVPECRSYKPVSYYAVNQACREFNKQYKISQCVVLGLRTAGSWGAAIMANNMIKANIDAHYFTIRPKKEARLKDVAYDIPFYIKDFEYEIFKYILKNIDYCCVVVVDDPVYTGKTLRAICEYLLRIGVKRIVYFPLGNFDNFNMPKVEVFKYNYLCNTYIENQFILNMIDLNFDFCYKMEAKSKTLHGSKIVFSDDKAKLYSAKFVGMGWFGKNELLRCNLLSQFVLPVVYYRDGYIVQKMPSECYASVYYDCVDAINQYRNYLDLVLNLYSFRTRGDQPLLWYNSYFTKGKWAYCDGRLYNKNFEGGHWGKLISFDEVFEKDTKLIMNTK